jgi:hypothetical protein
MSDWDSKPSDRRQWQEKPLKPTITRNMSKDEIEEFRKAQVQSYNCKDTDIFITWKKIKHKYRPNYEEIRADGIRAILRDIVENPSLSPKKQVFLDELDVKIENMKREEQELDKEMENFIILKYRMKGTFVVYDGEDADGKPICKTIFEKTISTFKIPIPETVKKQVRTRNTNLAIKY